MLRSRTLLTTAMLLGGFLRTASAQTPVLSQPAGCTYQTCALRTEPSFFGVSLVKGSGGERVSKLGGFGQGVDVLLSGPDSAAAFARTYVSATRTATTLGLLGAAAYVALLLHSDNFSGDADATDVTLAIGGAGLAIASIPFSLRAQRSLSRAVWWYNAALPR